MQPKHLQSQCCISVLDIVRSVPVDLKCTLSFGVKYNLPQAVAFLGVCYSTFIAVMVIDC